MHSILQRKSKTIVWELDSEIFKRLPDDRAKRYKSRDVNHHKYEIKILLLVEVTGNVLN